MGHFSPRVDPASPEPLFAQVVTAVREAVATGRLAEGDKLPSVRELARELVINPNTIAKAYEALERDGVTQSRRGAGTFVAARRVVLSDDERRRRLNDHLNALLTEAVHLGLTAEQMSAAFDDALTRYRFEGDAPPATEEDA